MSEQFRPLLEEALPLVLTHGWPGSVVEFLVPAEHVAAA